MGFVDMSVRNMTEEEVETDRSLVNAVKDVVSGNSEMNKQKLKRHLDRRGILSTFFGLRMDDLCIGPEDSPDTLKAHLIKLQNFKKEHEEGVGAGMLEMAGKALEKLSVDTGSDRVRASLEQADLTQLEDALVDAENAGIGNAVFRMSAVQAGSELRAIGENFRDWGKDNALKTGKLTRCQEEALGARKKLAAAQAKLQNGRHKNLETSSKWVLRFAETSSRGSVRVLFRSWSVYARFSSAERRVQCDYQERLVSADALLDSFRLRSKGALRRLLERQAVERCRQLALECFWLWQEILVQRKLDEECEQKLLDFQCKMKDMKQAQSENAKLILRRACAENDLALIRCCFQAFHETWQEAAQEQHIAVQVDLSQEKMKEFMKRKSTIALRLLKEMCYATAAGFQQEVFSSWVTLVQQSHGEGQLQGLLQQQQQRIEAVRQRSRNNNHLLVQGLEKQYHSDMQLEIFSHWRTFAGVESKVLGHKVKVDAKRQQLQGVQSLFRSFAAQLERQLRESHSQKESRLYKSHSMEIGLSEAPRPKSR